MTRISIFILSIIFITSCSNKSNQDSEGNSVNSGKAFQNESVDGQPIAYYLNMESIHPYVVDYYNGNITIEENEKTDSLLNVLIYQNSELTPFYYKCFMTICEDTGNELNNFLGSYCIKLLKEKTEYCIRKLRQGYPDYFTGLVANEIYRRQKWEEEINNLSLQLHINLENNAPELRKELDLFIVGLKNDIEHIQKEE